MSSQDLLSASCEINSRPSWDHRRASDLSISMETMDDDDDDPEGRSSETS